MMPIYFNVKEVHDYLVINGLVYTLRKPRSIGITDAVEGSYYNHAPFAKVEVVLVVANVERPDQLYPYVANSGLLREGESIIETAARWLELARKMSGNILDLYQVTLIEKYSREK